MRNFFRKSISVILSVMMILPSLTLSVFAEPRSYKLGDYTGKGTVIAVIDAGFDVSHEAFSVMPERAALTMGDVAKALGYAYKDAYVSKKIPLALDYSNRTSPAGEAVIDTDLVGISDLGTSLASLSAGCYIGRGDTVKDDGTVEHDGDFLGAAPDAQLLLMKAADDLSSILRASAVCAAVDDAIALDADVILLNLKNTEMNDSVRAALRRAEEKGIHVLSGTGDLAPDVQAAAERLPASVPERGTLMKEASLPGVYFVGAAADPFGHIRSFSFGETVIPYTDSSVMYLGVSFAKLFSGEAIEFVSIPGVGSTEDYEGRRLDGKIALVKRGEIPFIDKANAAAEAGAAGMIVIDNGGGLSQMALEGTSIPAVMISEADGALLLEAGEGTLTLPLPQYGIAPFSARGLAGSFDSTVSFLADGENVLCASSVGYTYRSGTQLAAATAAGYFAAATEYMNEFSIRGVSAQALVAACAVPLGGDSARFSPRDEGCGYLTKEGMFPTVIPLAASERTVTVAESEGESVSVTFTLTNTGKSAVHCKIGGSFFTESVGEDGLFTGERVPVPEAIVTVQDGMVGLTGGKADTVVVNGGRTARVTVTVTLPDAIRETLTANAPFGIFLDGEIEASAGGETVRHPITIFFGDRDEAPLADKTVYDGEDALVAPSFLAVRVLSESDVRRVGERTTETGETVFDTAYNLINPRELRIGRLELWLSALRDIETAHVRIIDAAGHTVASHTLKNIERYLAAGNYTVVPLSNFRAADESEYLFPSGTYTCEVILTANGGESTETLTFPVTADSIRPEITDICARMNEDGTVTLSVSAADNAALASVRVYDLSRGFGTKTVDGTEDSCSFDITGYRGDSPLYIEVTDAAGSYKVVRLTDRDIAALLAAAP